MSAGGVLGEGVAARIDPDDADSVRAALGDLDADVLRRLVREARHLVDDDDVTLVDETGAGAHRWRVDPLPLVLGQQAWARLAAGLVQRTTLLDLVLADLYGPRDLVRTGVLPAEVVFAHPGFLRPLDQVRPAAGRRLTTCATQLRRTTDGDWVPVADRTEVPSGAAYALENRSVLTRLLPDLHRAARVERLAPYVRALRRALRDAAPAGVDEPRVAVLTAGGPQAFEHGSLASLLGVPLVEGNDLSVRDGRVWLRSLGGDPVRIDVLLRRVDSWWTDPLELRSDASGGTPGLVEAVRRGGVTTVNALGAGVLENPGLHAFLPELARRLLGQELRLPGPRTLWCGEQAALDETLDRLDELVLRPLAPSAGGVVDPAATDAEGRADLRERVAAAPHRWVAQERVRSSPERAVTPDGEVVRTDVVLETFAVAHGDDYALLPGGLGRVVAPAGREPWSKDVWVLGGDHEPREDFWLHRGPLVAADAPESVVSARTVENMLWLGRYLERAEAAVRLLRAVDVRRGEVGGGTPALDRAVERLLVALTDATSTQPGFHDVGRRLHPGPELTALVLDAQREGTLAHAVAQLLEAARAVRDQLSADAWPVLTALERQLLGDDDAAAVLATGTRGPAHGRGALAHVLTLLLALHGLATESLVRDPSWRFLEAGRRLERAQQLVGLLRATVTQLDEHPAGDAAASLLLESVLVTTESIITYRRRYRSRAQLATVLELLLRDEGNPRSLRWQLQRLAAVVPDLGGDAGAPATDAVRAAAAALRMAELETLRGDALAGLLTQLDDHLQRVGSELARTVLAPPPTPRPMVEERPGLAGDTLLA